MKFAAFNARCPFEIGDKIKTSRRVSPEEAGCFGLDPAAVVEEVHTITDIVCEHSVKHGTVIFLYELDDSGKLVHIAAAQRPQGQEGQAEDRGDEKKCCGETESGCLLPPEFVAFVNRRFG